MTLAPGQSTTVGSTLALRFRGVVRDSRCPANATCLVGMQGEAVLAFDVASSGGGPVTHELKSDGPGRTLTLASHVVEVEAVAPYPFSYDPIPAADYRATLLITSRQ